MTAPLGARVAAALGRLVAQPLRGLLAWRPGVDGRLVIVVGVTAYLALVAVARLMWQVDLWPHLGVPSGPSLFFDARNLTAAWECQRLGFDPLYESPCDPWGRPLMYLRPWLVLGAVGLDQSHTAIVAVVLIVGMLASFGILLGRVPAGTGGLLTLALCSPAVMFAIERANMDLALFSVLSVAVVLWRAFPRSARLVSPLLVLVAATAKIYPVFALPAFALARSRRAARAAVAATAAFAAYLVVNRADIRHVAEIATQGEHFSFGARILIAHLYHQMRADQWAGPAVLKQLLAIVPLGCVAVVIAVRVHRQLGDRHDTSEISPAPLIAFQCGALIYLGSFAVANNFDYRLVFLLLTLPQLIEWARAPTHRMSSLAAITIVATLLLLWVGSLSRVLQLWDELATWLVAGLLAAILTATLPSLRAARETLLGRALEARSRP